MEFLRKADVLAIHRRAIDEHGGDAGLLSDAALESAIIAAENRHWYENAELAVCAATYAFHLCQAHAFMDGNKRVAMAATEVFLIINGARMNATDDALYAVYMGIA